MSTIITRNSATSGSSPSSLVQGELAINVTDNRLYFGSGSANTVKEFGVTSSYALQALSASYAVSASHEIIKEISSSYADTASFAQSGNGIFSGSFSGSYEGDGSNLTGIDAFPYTGDAQITGSLLISGSKIHLRGQSASPGPILELESINGGSGKDVYVKVGDSNENYAYVFGADDTGNTFRISGGSYSSATLGTNDRFIIDGNDIEFPAGNISGSITSTASFGTYIGDGSQLTGVISSSYALTASHALNAGGGGAGFPFTGDAVITGSLVVSASATSQSLSVQGSGSTVFDVIGSVGTLFSIDDDLNGMLFTANDISGFPVLQASASGDVFIGKTPQSLYTTTVISSTTAATTHSLCTLSTSSYDGAFFEYTAQSGSNARAGNIMSTWNGSNIVYAETTTADIGRTSDLTTEVIISGSTARLVAYGANAGYKIKTIIKAI